MLYTYGISALAHAVHLRYPHAVHLRHSGAKKRKVSQEAKCKNLAVLEKISRLNRFIAAKLSRSNVQSSGINQST